MKNIFDSYASIILPILIILVCFMPHPFFIFAIICALYFLALELILFFSGTSQVSQEPVPSSPSFLIVSRVLYGIFNGPTIEFFEQGRSIAFWRRDRSGKIISKEGRVMNGNITFYYKFNGRCLARTAIRLINNNFPDGDVIWLRGNGGKYMEYKIDNDGAYSGMYYSYYPDGSTKKRVWLSDGLPVGMLEKFYPDGSIMKRAQYKKGVKDGAYTVYYAASGNAVRETGSFVGGKLVGYVRKYYLNGGKESEIYYINNTITMQTFYRQDGIISNESYTKEFREKFRNNRELIDMKRRIRAKMKLAKYGFEMFDPQSDAFPRIRAIRKPNDGFILREFSCEEELIKFVLKSGFKEFVDERIADSKKGMVIKEFNEKGRLVRVQ
jgi:hypothetical protein